MKLPAILVMIWSISLSPGPAFAGDAGRKVWIPPIEIVHSHVTDVPAVWPSDSEHLVLPFSIGMIQTTGVVSKVSALCPVDQVSPGQLRDAIDAMYKNKFSAEQPPPSDRRTK